MCVKGEWGNTKYIELVGLKADGCREFVSVPLCTDGGAGGHPELAL